MTTDTPPKAPRPRRVKTTGPTETTNKGGNGGTGRMPPLDPLPDDSPGEGKSPPKSSPRGRRAAAGTGTGRPPSPASLEARLTEFLSAAALPFAIAGDTYCAAILTQRTPALAHALSELAKENPGVRKVLNRMLEGSAWGGVGLAVFSIVIPVAQHHGLVPGEDPFGWQYPDTPARGAVASPPAGFGGWSTTSGNDRSSMGAPTESDEPTMTQFPGAPPGVVTVEATGANHTGSHPY